ncbi:MAG: hypothetical protein IJI14_02955 [Anaerolineaceae bacterium]|nr:hypothetical protein [Anaerolineaceae bacterium]
MRKICLFILMMTVFVSCQIVLASDPGPGEKSDVDRYMEEHGLTASGHGTIIDEDGNRVPDFGSPIYTQFIQGEITEQEGFKRCTGYVGDGTGCPNTPAAVPHEYYDKMSGKCGCPTTPKYKVNGCNITISCDLEDDSATIVEVKVPCPTVAATDPKYPLVKMLSGTLIEWRVDDEYVEAPHVLVYTNASTMQGYGTELFTDFNLDIVVSSVDTGAKWDIKKAEAIVIATESHSRDNIEFMLTGGNPNVKVLTAKDIYNAYRTKSDEVQAYLALAGKGWGERPWTTYEKFVQAMCKHSKSPRNCYRALVGQDHYSRVGNYYLGNGNPTILGVYSEISSHGCHGATVVNDKGEPAFAINFKSTFCIYMHASWQGYFVWSTARQVPRGSCCVEWHEKHEEIGNNCESPEHGRQCFPIVRTTVVCDQWKDFFSCEDEFVYGGPGESAEDCKQCIDIEGYLDASGAMHTDPLAISFYQSQPLLIKGN